MYEYHTNIVILCTFVCQCVYLCHTEPLDDLTTTVRALFSPIVNKSVPVPEYPDHPYTANELQVTVMIQLCIESFWCIYTILSLFYFGVYYLCLSSEIVLRLGIIFVPKLCYYRLVYCVKLYYLSFLPSSRQTWTEYVPVKDIRQVLLQFPLPDITEHYQSNVR